MQSRKTLDDPLPGFLTRRILDGNDLRVTPSRSLYHIQANRRRHASPLTRTDRARWPTERALNRLPSSRDLQTQ